MALRIKQDHRRFRQIVRGRIKENLKKYISKGEMIGKKGRDKISIPVPQIDLPHFVYDHRDSGGVGQGDGEVGDTLAPGNIEEGDGKQAGSEAGEHVLVTGATGMGKSTTLATMINEVSGSQQSQRSASGTATAISARPQRQRPQEGINPSPPKTSRKELGRGFPSISRQSFWLITPF